MKTDEIKIDSEKDLHIQLLKESMYDVRDQRNFFKCMNLILCVIVFCLICGMTCLGVYNQKCLKEIALYKYQNLELNYVKECNTD